MNSCHAPLPTGRTHVLELEAINDNAVQISKLMGARLDAAICSGHIKANHHGHFDLLPRQWVAEITGTDPKFGFKRAFLRGKKGYSRANSVGSRGIYFVYLLEEGRIYEVNSPVSWKRDVRYFCRYMDGRKNVLSKEEVLQCLKSNT